MKGLAVSALLLLSLAPPPSARSTPSSGIRVDTIVHGVKLSLILARQTYPASALVRASVQVQNLFGHPIAAIDYVKPQTHPLP